MNQKQLLHMHLWNRETIKITATIIHDIKRPFYSVKPHKIPLHEDCVSIT